PARKPTPAELARRTPLGGDPIMPGDMPRGSTAIVAAATNKELVKLTNAEYRKRYVSEISGGMSDGRLFKFDKNGEFVTTGDGTVLLKDSTYKFLSDETQISWVKFKGPGEGASGMAGPLRKVERAHKGKNRHKNCSFFSA